MTIIETRNGKTLKVNGSFSEVVANYSAKPNTVLFQSRINDNMMIQINGIVIGEILKN